MITMDNKEKFVLGWWKNSNFANGFQVLRKVEMICGGYGYKYGQHWVSEPILEWDLNSLDLKFEDVEVEYKPTLFERIKKVLLRKDYPKYATHRPADKSIVIAEYNGGDFYEMIEYNNKRWIAELCTYMKPERFAYLPEGICREKCLELIKSEDERHKVIALSVVS